MLGFGLGLNKWRRVGGGYVGLLDLFPNAAAAYSLRKLRAAYSGSAVRVRRSSDNTEQDIGFTTQGELDTASLLSFVNEDVDVYTSDFISSIDGWGNNNMTLSSNQTIGGSSGWLECEATTNSGILKRAKAPIALEGGCSYRVQSKVYVESGNNVGGLYIGADGNGLLVSTTDTDEVVELDVTFTASTGGDLEWFMTDSSLNPNFTGGLGKSIYIKDTIITQTTADGLVSTWYDQSLSNDATQSTGSAQPKIVSGGSLVTENGKAAVDFDGSDDYFTLGGTNDAGLINDISIFCINKSLTNVRPLVATGRTATTNTNQIQWGLNRASGVYTVETSDGTTKAEIIGSTSAGSQALTSFINDESANLTLFINGSSDGTVGAVSPMNDVSLPLEIGRDPFREALYFNGNMQELIMYNAVQTSNRTSIETNINTFYSIYP